jgi:predicted nucleic acid-binding protein
MNEPRRELRRWRAWACWALTRRILPHLPGDPRHAVEEPAAARIFAELAARGLPGESDLWLACCAGAIPEDRPPFIGE